MAVRKECVCRNELLGNPCTAAVSLALREGGAARLHQKSNFGSHSREAASGTRPSSRAPPSPSPLRWAITSSQQRCFDRAVLWCQHRVPLGSRHGRDFWGSYCWWRGCWAAARHEAPQPHSLERAASPNAAAAALGSCLALAEIAVEFADSARAELSTCSQVLWPIGTAAGYEKHARAFIPNNWALSEYCELKTVGVVLSWSTSLLSFQGAFAPRASVKMFIYYWLLRQRWRGRLNFPSVLPVRVNWHCPAVLSKYSDLFTQQNRSEQNKRLWWNTECCFVAVTFGSGYGLHFFIRRQNQNAAETLSINRQWVACFFWGKGAVWLSFSWNKCS